MFIVTLTFMLQAASMTQGSGFSGIGLGALSSIP
jgi:hypothetical protein